MQHHHFAHRFVARFLRVVLPGSAILCSTSVLAAVYNFIPGVGAGSADPSATANWNDANNWVNGTSTFAIPGSTDQASASTSGTTIVNSAVPAVNEIRFANNAPGATLNGAYTATSFATLEIDSGGSLTILSNNGTTLGNCIIGNAQPSNGTLIMNGGTLTTGSTVAITDDFASSNYTVSLVLANTATASGASHGTLLMQSGTVNLGNNLVMANATNGANIATAVVNQTGGVISAAGAVMVGTKGIGIYQMSAGTLSQLGTNANGSALGRDAFYLGQAGNGFGTFTQSGTAAVSIANGLYIANATNSSGTYSISGGALTIAGDLSVGAATGAGIGTAAPVSATSNPGRFQIVGNAAATITANHITTNTANSTLGFTINSTAGTSLLSLTAATVGGVSYDGSAQLGGGFIDIDPGNAFTPSPGDVYELIRAVTIPNLPTLVLDGDAFDSSTLSIRDNGDSTFSLMDTMPVPEPTSVMLMTLPAMIIALKRRRRFSLAGGKYRSFPIAAAG
jgi:hypothetical protein